jgi:hypothetical protein
MVHNLTGLQNWSGTITKKLKSWIKPTSILTLIKTTNQREKTNINTMLELPYLELFKITCGTFKVENFEESFFSKHVLHL